VKENAVGTASLAEFASGPDEARAIWLMVPAGVVDRPSQIFCPISERGDILIDGGNSYYIDDILRGKELAPKGITMPMSAPAAAFGGWSSAIA